LSFFSSRRRHTRFSRDWSSDVCSSDLKYRYESRVFVLSVVVDLSQAVVVPTGCGVIMNELVFLRDVGGAVAVDPTDPGKVCAIDAVFNVKSFVVNFRCRLPLEERLRSEE